MHIRRRSGQVEEVPNNYVLADGEALAAGFFMDGSLDPLQRAVLMHHTPVTDGLGGPVGLRPGFAFSTELTEARRKADEVWEERGRVQADAWRHPPGLQPIDNQPSRWQPTNYKPAASLSVAEARRQADAAWEERGRIISEAWKNPS